MKAKNYYRRASEDAAAHFRSVLNIYLVRGSVINKTSCYEEALLPLVLKVDLGRVWEARTCGTGVFITVPKH